MLGGHRARRGLPREGRAITKQCPRATSTVGVWGLGRQGSLAQGARSPRAAMSEGPHTCLPGSTPRRHGQEGAPGLVYLGTLGTRGKERDDLGGHSDVKVSVRWRQMGRSQQAQLSLLRATRGHVASKRSADLVLQMLHLEKPGLACKHICPCTHMLIHAHMCICVHTCVHIFTHTCVIVRTPICTLHTCAHTHLQYVMDLYTCMHTYACIPTCTQAPSYMHTCTRMKYAYTYTHVHLHIFMCTPMHPHTCVHMYTLTYMCVHTCKCTHAQGYMDTCTYKCTHLHLHAHTHMHTCIHKHVYA